MKQIFFEGDNKGTNTTTNKNSNSITNVNFFNPHEINLNVKYDQNPYDISITISITTLIFSGVCDYEIPTHLPPPSHTHTCTEREITCSYGCKNITLVYNLYTSLHGVTEPHTPLETPASSAGWWDNQQKHQQELWLPAGARCCSLTFSWQLSPLSSQTPIQVILNHNGTGIVQPVMKIQTHVIPNPCDKLLGFKKVILISSYFQ